MSSAKFEEFIENPRIFKIILDEFFRTWSGTYDVMTVENPRERFFKNSANFAEFCHKVRTTEEGYKRCMDCDIRYAMEAKEKKSPLHYICHAGLLDIAVPIIVGEELIATICCGQSRSWDQKTEREAQLQTSLTETELGFRKGELLKLRKKFLLFRANRWKT